MTRYVVEWEADAERELADIWLQSSDPDAVTQSQTRIDGFLARDPAGHGRHLGEGLWQIADPPLAVSYTIDDAARSVQVTWVARTA